MDEVVIKGQAFTGQFNGFDINRLALFKWSGSAFEPIPFQIDEVKKQVDLLAPLSSCVTGLPPGTTVCESNYAFNADATPGADDFVGLDSFDELVFIARDAGPQAPASAQYPPGTNWYNWRYDIRIADEKLLNGVPTAEAESWVYLFYSTVAIEPLYGDKHYVTWIPDNPDGSDTEPPASGLPAETCRSGDDSPDRGKKACGWARGFVDATYGQASYPTLDVHWIGNWTQNRLRFRPTSGSVGPDRIDRQKYRVGNLDGTGIQENEYSWDTSTCARMIGLKIYDSAKRAPTRIDRKIQGNQSGSTSSRNDWYYGTHLRTRTRLRVHPGLPQFRMFLDYLQDPITKELFTKTYPGPARADQINGTGVEHNPITSYTKSEWIRWDAQISGSERVYLFLRETRPLSWTSADQSYSDDGTADTETVGNLQKQAGGYGKHGLTWSGSSMDMQDLDCYGPDPDGDIYTRKYRELESVVFAAIPDRTAANFEDWLTRPLQQYASETSLPYVPPPAPLPPCQPTTAGSSPAAGLFAELTPSFGVGCTPGTTGFSVFRAIGGGAFRFLGKGTVGATLRDHSVVPGVTYRYQVFGHNRNGSYSVGSQVVSVQVQDTEVPVAPTAISAQPLQQGARITWTNSSSWDATGHDVYVASLSGGPYQKITLQPVAIETSEFAISGLDPNTLYYVVVQAVDRVGNHSSSSAQVSVLPLP